VFVTGTMTVPGVGSVPPANYATVAYAAGTGKVLWGTRYLGDSGLNVPVGIAVSPRGDRVFVTGYSQYFNPSPTPLYKYATVGYSARTGGQLWAVRYGSFRDGTNMAAALAISPRGDLVFVTGKAQYAGTIGAPQFAYVTTALRAASGRSAWTAQFVGAPGGSDVAADVAVAPRGDLVYVTGGSSENRSVAGNPLPAAGVIATLAYSAASGKQVWLTRFASPVPSDNAVGTRLAVAPSGQLAVGAVIGPLPGLAGQAAVISYDGRQGTQSWVARYDVRDPTLIGGNFPVGLAYHPNGGRLYTEDQMAPLSNTCPPTTSCSQEPGYGLLLSYQS
jgi:DNA-binding beta-propeller fold protein YncE